MTERRAPVQGDAWSPTHSVRPYRRGDGSIPWSTHELAWQGYAAAGHGSQSAERIAQRSGFGYREVQCAIAGHYNLTGRCDLAHPAPAGWEPRR